MPAWLREPLLHFVVIGFALFAIDKAVVTQEGDPRVITVGRDVDDEAVRLFKASRGKEPTEDELAALRKVWLDNEVLYREGLALQLDKGDPAIRERIIFKALSVVDAGVKLPRYDDKVLRDWFEGHRLRYDEPTRFTFQEAMLSGDSSESAVRAFVLALNSGVPGEAKAGLRVFKGRPRTNLEQSYGLDFADALSRIDPGEWHALASSSGWRAIRLDEIIPARPADFAALKNVVLQDWTDTVLAEQRSAAVRVMAQKYDVRRETSAK